MNCVLFSNIINVWNHPYLTGINRISSTCTEHTIINLSRVVTQTILVGDHWYLDISKGVRAAWTTWNYKISLSIITLISFQWRYELTPYSQWSRLNVSLWGYQLDHSDHTATTSWLAHRLFLQIGHSKVTVWDTNSRRTHSKVTVWNCLVS